MMYMTLVGLLMATLDHELIALVVGCPSTRNAWDMFSSVSRASIMQLKTDLQTIKKGSDSIEQYLLRIKSANDQLAAVGVPTLEEDLVVVILGGLYLFNNQQIKSGVTAFLGAAVKNTL